MFGGRYDGITGEMIGEALVECLAVYGYDNYPGLDHANQLMDQLALMPSDSLLLLTDATRGYDTVLNIIKLTIDAFDHCNISAVDALQRLSLEEYLHKTNRALLKSFIEKYKNISSWVKDRGWNNHDIYSFSLRMAYIEVDTRNPRIFLNRAINMAEKLSWAGSDALISDYILHFYHGNAPVQPQHLEATLIGISRGFIMICAKIEAGVYSKQNLLSFANTQKERYLELLERYMQSDPEHDPETIKSFFIENSGLAKFYSLGLRGPHINFFKNAFCEEAYRIVDMNKIVKSVRSTIKHAT